MPYDDGGPAFPVPSGATDTGMTLADKIASDVVNSFCIAAKIPGSGGIDQTIVTAAYDYAEAVVAEKRAREAG